MNPKASCCHGKEEPKTELVQTDESCCHHEAEHEEDGCCHMGHHLVDGPGIEETENGSDNGAMTDGSSVRGCCRHR